MKKNKIVMSVISGLLVAAVAVGGTLAYMSDKTETLTNTFSVGSGYTDVDGHQGLWLDETDNPAEGVNPTEVSTEKRTNGDDTVTYTDLLPADIVAKDPTFHLTEGSIESYVFAEVTGLDALVENEFIIKPDNVFDDKTSELNSNWVKVSGEEGTLDGVYRYTVTVEGGDVMAPMFQYIKFDADVNSDRFEEIKASPLDNVVVRGVAVQADNLEADEALVEAQGIFNNWGE